MPMNESQISDLSENESVHNANLESERVIYQIMLSEYEREHQRTATLDNKASLFITVIIAVITIFVPVIPYAGIVTAFRECHCHTGIDLLLILLGISVVFIALALTELYRAFKLKAFARPKLEEIDTKAYLYGEEQELLDDLISYYHLKVILKNIEVNNDKAKHLRLGILFVIIEFAMMFASVVGLNFLTA